MKIIDNFLEEEYFKKLVDLIISNKFAWYYNPFVASETEISDSLSLWFLTHMFYDSQVPEKILSSYYSLLLPLCDKIEIKSMIRMRANFYPNTSTLYEHQMHTDKNFSHTAALLSLNTCDGYTKLADGTKVDSIANRVVLFDAGENHCSTTTTNEKARINLIVNYL